MQDVSALVARQYEAFPYPPPSFDLARSIADGGYQVGDPSLWRPLLWPEGGAREARSILVAGCGTTQAAWFAYTNRGAEVVGVDLSEESLAHERFLQDKHGLQNLRLFKGDLRDIGAIGRDFDLIVCTGVLHHMSDPDAGMRALAGAMRADAVLAGMVYGATRRAGVYILQDAFRRLGVRANAEGAGFVRRTLAALPAWHFVQQYVDASTELAHDAALVDTFLHAQDRAYTVPQLLALVEDNGLAFQGWFDNSVYYPDGVTWLSPEIAQRTAALPDREQWAVVEMLCPAISTHYFFARKGAPAAVSPAAPDCTSLVAHQRPGLRRDGPGQYRRAGRMFELTAAEAALFKLIDGARTLAQLIAHADTSLSEADARALIDRLWKQGHVLLTRS
jgi:SAM-dependent methyltransferase